jgi:hypothetical protein
MLTMRREGARISVNKLGEYITSKAARQRSILYNQKFPPDYVTPFYDDATEAISQFIAGGMERPAILENQIRVLGQAPINTPWQQRRMLGNIEAIETFMGMMDDLDLSGLACRLGSHNPPKMPIRNIEVSVRPEVILSRPAPKGGRQVGALKLHFPKTNPLSEESAGYVSAVSARFCDTYLSEEGDPDSRLCFVLDLASARLYPGVKSTRQRLKDVDAACEQIFNLWDTIKEE